MLIAVLLAACTGGSSSPAPPDGQGSTTAPAVRTIPNFQLLTHCGIGEARIGSHYFEAVHPLSDGNGNPPAGWGNPFQTGTMTQVSPTEAVFANPAGHRVVFRLRAGATSFRKLCD